MQHRVRSTEPAGLPQRQVFRVIARQRDLSHGVCLWGVDAVQPTRHGCLVRAAERIERSTLAKRDVQRSPAIVRFGPLRPYRRSRIVEARRERSERFGQQRFEPQAQVLGQPGRRASGADRDQDRIAFEHAGHSEIAQFRPVGDVHEQPARLQPGVGGGGRVRVVQRHEAERGGTVLALLDYHAARPLDQPAFGLAHGAFGHQHDGRVTRAVEDGQRAQSHGGTVSAAMMAPGAIRSATVAKRSPSTITSGTKPRLL